MTPQEVRNIRLKNDYQQMCNIKGSIIDWIPIRGIPPHIEEYKLTVNIRTIIDSTPSYRSRHELSLVIPTDYPVAPPIITMVSQPKPFHPNWWPNGLWCKGSYHMSESLGDFVIRMIKTLQFDPLITDPNSSADPSASRWYERASSQRYFPCDNTVLPDPTNTQPIAPKRFEIVEKKRFDIK